MKTDDPLQREAREAFLQTTLDSLSAKIVILDQDGRILSANTAWVATRRQEGEAGDGPVGGGDYFTLRHNASGTAAADAQRLAEGIRRVLRGELACHEGEYPWPGAVEERWDRVCVTRFAGDGPARVVVAHEDITSRHRAEQALRRSEERYHLALAGSGAGLWDCDVRTGDFYASPRLQELLGRGDTHVPRLSQMDAFIALLHPEDRPRMEQAITAHLYAQQPYDVKCRLRSLDGEHRWFRVCGQAVWDTSGEPTRMAGSVVDISEQVHAEEENRGLEHQLAQAQKMEAIGTLAGGIAHDFNNILGTIIGYAELALSAVSEEQPRSDLDQIVKSSQRARDLVRQILAFSRQQPPQRKVLVLQEEVQEALRLARAGTPATVEWEVHCAEDPILVCADRAQLGQVVINLTNNALQALKHHQGRIRVQVDTYQPTAAQLAAAPSISPGASMARVIFQDNGKGFAPENLDRVFDPFFTTKAPGEGTGLGLSVVHGIVKSHGGCITAANENAHGGAILTLLLPRATDADVEPATLSPDLHLGSGERILLVEDDTALGVATARHLERLGYEVALETSSVRALRRFAEHPEHFDVLITDQAMPGIPGMELAAAVSAARPELPILLVTGRREGLDPVLLAEAGIRTVHQKPLELAELAAAVHACLRPLAAA
jgi:PAS domain S-box-containing protein